MRILTLAITLSLLTGGAFAQIVTRVKDIVNYKYTGPSVLHGEGLVYGLNGTGDGKDLKTAEMLKAVSQQLNKAKIPASSFLSKNVARVLITVKVPPFKGLVGNELECIVSAAAGSKSLENGILFRTGLLNASDSLDRTQYAEAAGAITLAQGPKPRDPNNGTVRCTMLHDIPIAFFQTHEDDYGKVTKTMSLLLINPDSSTANEIAARINENPEVLGIQTGTVSKGRAPEPVARAVHDGLVRVIIPERWHDDEMAFKEIVDLASVNPDLVATITINESGGVIAFSGNVRVLPGAFTVRGITVTIGPGGDLPSRPDPGDEVTDATVPVNQPNVQLQQLIDTFNLLKLTIDEKIAVIRTLELNQMLLSKVTYK